MELNLATLTPDELLARFEDQVQRKATEIYVILNAERTSCLYDPGMQRPWHNFNLARAVEVARETGGVAVSLAEAIPVLYEQYRLAQGQKGDMVPGTGG